MKRLADRLDAIKPSLTGVVTERALVLRAEGVDIISLSVGEPDFDTPPHIIDAAKKALDQGATRYTAAHGIPELRCQVARQSEQIRRTPVSEKEVIITAGAKHALYNFFQAVLDPGDEVIIPMPYWVSYPDQVRLAEGVPIIAETLAENDFVLSVDTFNRLKTPKTRVVVINTPGNPTGTVYGKEELKALTDAATKEGIYVLSDEVYRELVFDDAAHISPVSLAPDAFKERVFVVDGVSKTYAMTGWRIGWGIGHPDIISSMAKIQSQSTSNPSSVSQHAALAAITLPEDFLNNWRKAFQARRDALLKGLASIPGISCTRPTGAFYALPSVKGVLEKMSASATDITLCTYLLDEAKVALVPGSAFGAPGHVRIAYATSLETIQEAIKRIREAVEKI